MSYYSITNHDLLDNCRQPSATRQPRRRRARVRARVRRTGRSRPRRRERAALGSGSAPRGREVAVDELGQRPEGLEDLTLQVTVVDPDGETLLTGDNQLHHRHRIEL